MHRRVARQNIEIPGEPGGGVIAAFRAPAHDLAIAVPFARVRTTDRRFITTGTWLELTPDSTGMGLAEIHIHTRQAGSIVGATTMDRPEWVAANPNAAEVYCCLTNNKNRGK